MSVVLTPSVAGVPTFTHFGADLGELSTADLLELGRAHAPSQPHSALDAPRWLGIVPENVRGFTGAPGLEGHRFPASAGVWAPRLDDWSCSTVDNSALLTGHDDEAGWSVAVKVELTPHGLLRMRTSVTNSGAGRLALSAVRTVVPVAARATELLDLTGRWCKERSPQRHQWVQGRFAREARHGRTGHDASLLMMAGTPGFGFGHGEVWALHTAWSGDHVTYAERTPEGECLLGGGELLAPGEVVLEPGQSYDAPWLLASYSHRGMDGVAARFHGWLRSMSPRSRRPRPVVVNTWEAVYFDHDLGTLRELATRAASVGCERFVLDDGWFTGRRDDQAGLGDWQVDSEVWPEGLGPLIDTVHAHGMEFGLWVEPEMVNLDSDLARSHPDWILRGRESWPEGWRHQQVLDLQVPEAYAYVRDALLALLDEYRIAFLKWDHNRDLVDVAHDGRPAVHGQTRAFYRLLDDLRETQPGLEIETCASGGGRVDLEVLTRADRIWPSDTIDALERQQLQCWTSLLVPPELIGSHVGGPVAHTTGRSHRLGYRAATALLYHFGVEADISDELTRIALSDWIALHKQIRPIISTGRLVHGDHPDPAILITGVVAEDASEAWYVVATVASTATQIPTPIRLPGLDPAVRYAVTIETPTHDQHTMDLGETWTSGEVTLLGAVLMEVGVRMPVLPPETAHVIRAHRFVSGPAGAPRGEVADESG